MTTWTAPDLTPDELDAVRQIVEGEYRPWCPDRPNGEIKRGETKAKRPAEKTLFCHNE